MPNKTTWIAACALAASTLTSAQPCTEGQAGPYPCHRVDLLAFIPLAELSTTPTEANDLWGFSEAGREFVMLGLGNGTAFVEITNPAAPVYLGSLPTHSSPSPWRDIKVYDHHAFIVSEAPNHGMQVFDLLTLLDVAAPPVVFSANAHYSEQFLSNSHNVAIDETSGFAYLTGTNTCNSGLHIVDVRLPRQPRFAGCFSADGYTHDAQCITYQGPDLDYVDREVCFAFNEDTVTIVDVTDKAAPRQISRTSYPGVGYTHQGWVTEDQLFLLLGDELDEENFHHNTLTRIFDITDLERPLLIAAHTAGTPSIDHNMYLRDGFAYQANYRAGLRILHLDRIAEGQLRQFGFFDIYPLNDDSRFSGAWSVYPFFPSGVVAISGIEQGLFLVSPRFATSP